MIYQDLQWQLLLIFHQTPWKIRWHCGPVSLTCFLQWARKAQQIRSSVQEAWLLGLLRGGPLGRPPKKEPQYIMDVNIFKMQETHKIYR